MGKPILWLEDLVVLPNERGQGAGKAILQTLARIAVKRGCGRMEWSVLDWNAPAIRFYRRIGARLDKEWVITRLKGAPLRQLARSRSARRASLVAEDGSCSATTTRRASSTRCSTQTVRLAPTTSTSSSASGRSRRWSSADGARWPT